MNWNSWDSSRSRELQNLSLEEIFVAAARQKGA